MAAPASEFVLCHLHKSEKKTSTKVRRTTSTKAPQEWEEPPQKWQEKLHKSEKNFHKSEKKTSTKVRRKPLQRWEEPPQKGEENLHKSENNQPVNSNELWPIDQCTKILIWTFSSFLSLPWYQNIWFDFSCLVCWFYFVVSYFSPNPRFLLSGWVLSLSW